MMNREAEIEKEWGTAFVHESGHAVMAVLQGIPYHGVYYDSRAKKFWALTNLGEPAEYTKSHFLFLMAGSAAEEIKYGDYDEEGAKSDRQLYFQNPAPPPLEDMLGESKTILSGRIGQLNSVVARLKPTMNQAKGRTEYLRVRNMEGTDRKFAVLLTKQELEGIVQF